MDQLEFETAKLRVSRKIMIVATSAAKGSLTRAFFIWQAWQFWRKLRRHRCRGLNRTARQEPEVRAKESRMQKKPTRTETEMADLIMREVREHPDCEGVAAVAITRPVQHSPNDPNWNVAFVRNGAASTPPAAFAIAQRFRIEFDLA